MKIIKRVIGILMILSFVLFVGYQIVNDFGSYTWGEYLISVGCIIAGVIVFFAFFITAMNLIDPDGDKEM